MTADADDLNPAQRRVVEELMSLGAARPTFAVDLADGLKAWLDDELESVVATTERLVSVTKRDLAHVHTCEAHFLSEDAAGFEWSPRVARGSVAHKALELAMALPGGEEPVPLEVVDHAIASLSLDASSGLGAYLARVPALERAELRSGANDVVVKFLESWPRLRAAWSPRTESTIRAELCGGRVELRGKVDLAMGRAQGQEARVLIVDLKTGRTYASHLDDLRFYALVQTLRIGVPPFRVASYYLDTATFHCEDVTVEGLELAVRRTVDGVRKLVELRQGVRPAEISPGPTCRYCRLRFDCDGPGLLAADGPDLDAF